MKKRLVYLVPLGVFLVLAVYFAVGLTKDPRVIPSALIDKPVPEFALPPITGGNTPGFTSDDLKKGGVTVVNVFASWCVPCRIEHPVVEALARMKVARVFGLNYKDKPDDALRWLKELGNPYDAIGADESGRVGIDWGVYGVPETFIVDGQGKIRHKHVGPMSQDTLKSEILPIIERLKR